MMLTSEEQITAAAADRPDDFEPAFAHVLPVAIETAEVKFERNADGRWRATCEAIPGLLVEADTIFAAEAAVPAAVKALRDPPPDEPPRFTVEPIHYSGYGIGDYAIRYTPKARTDPDGTKRFSLSFHALIAGDLLSDPKAVLEQVAAVLNASPIGRPE